MLLIIGFLVVIGSVFGGYALAGGHLLVLFQPVELLMIGGAAVGAFIIGNDSRTIKAALKGMGSTFKPIKYNKQFNIDLLLLFFDLNNKIRKEGVISIEEDIQNVQESELMSRYPKIQNDPKIMEFICDNLQLVTTGRINTHQFETIIDEDIEAYETESEIPIGAVNRVADGLPAFGIVAAVMGVIHAMESISQPPDVLGVLIANALVGTFLGVLLAYGMVAPIVAAMEARRSAMLKILFGIKVLLLAIPKNVPPTIAVELARKVLYSDIRPKNTELEEIIRENKESSKA